MKTSVGLPTGMEGLIYPVPFASPHEIVGIAKKAEELKYHGVWGNDHMTTQSYVQEDFSQPPNYLEPLITYAYIAAETSTLRMGTGMLVLPMRRDIVVAAKQIATLDHLSKGRFDLGIGLGAYREEFEALHPDWEVHRGNMVEEGLVALKALFEERSATFEGKYYKFRNVEMYPKAYQAHLPVYIGGNNRNTVERAARFGDAWLPACMPIDNLRTQIARLGELAEQNGRQARDIEITPQYAVCVAKTHEEAMEKFQNSQLYKHLITLTKSTLKEQGSVSHEEINLVGSVDEVIEKARALREIGVTHLLGLLFAANTVPEFHEQMEIFATEVAPHI